MATLPIPPWAGELPPPYLGLLTDWGRSLKAANKSPSTLRIYLEGAALLGRFTPDIDVRTVTRRDVAAFIDDQLTRLSPASASSRFRACRVFFNWLVMEGAIDTSPMAKMPQPKVPEKPVPVITDDDVDRLLRACVGRDFDDLRDMAIVRLFADTGMRRAELTGLRLDDLDRDQQIATVLGKGSRIRSCPYTDATAAAIDRYLRSRSHHPAAKSSALWLGHVGPLTADGIRRIIDRRAALAGLAGIHPHLFRHAMADGWLRAGGNEGDLMMLGGWKSREVMARYGRSAAESRAIDAYRKMKNGRP